MGTTAARPHCTLAPCPSPTSWRRRGECGFRLRRHRRYESAWDGRSKAIPSHAIRRTRGYSSANAATERRSRHERRSRTEEAAVEADLAIPRRPPHAVATVHARYPRSRVAHSRVILVAVSYEPCPSRSLSMVYDGYVLKYPVLWFIRGYQSTIGRLMPAVCRFEPTCSRYSYEAVERHGAFRGTWLMVRRLSRCRPGGGSGYDPVPD
jgi:putative membrane protein insertion efficiency factor